MNDIELLEKLNCCEKTRNIIRRKYNGDFFTALNKNKNADEIIWLIAALGVDKSRLRLLACRLVRETPLVDGRKVWDLLTDERSRKAIEVAEKHAQGKASDDELRAARDDARDAAHSTSKEFSRDAAWAATRAITNDVEIVARATAYAARFSASASDADSDIISSAQIKIIYDFFPLDEIFDMIKCKRDGFSQNDSA